MVFHKALELRINVAVVLDASDVMLLRHPLDHEDREGDAEWFMRKDLLSDLVRRSDHLTLRTEVVSELFLEDLEQLNVLDLFANELKECANTPIVFVQRRTNMVEDERHNEF